MAIPQTPNLPVLDLNNVEDLKPGTNSWLSACRDVRKALEEHGCFLVSYGKISPKLKEDAYLAIKELFDLPTERKQSHKSALPSAGYYLFPDLPLYENLTLLNTRDEKTMEDFISFMMPSGNEQIVKNLDSYRAQVVELQEILMRMLFESYGLEKYFNPHKESTVYSYRANKYRPPTGKENNLGASAHTDHTFVTILSSSQTQGLEIQGKDGNWIPVYFPPSSFVVLASDAVEAWSNGRIRSCFHKVTMTADEDRYSIGIFFMYNGTVTTPKELLDDSNPSLYEPFDHFDLLRYGLSEGAHLVGTEKLRESFIRRRTSN